jgi:hypothetical protein
MHALNDRWWLFGRGAGADSMCQVKPQALPRARRSGSAQAWVSECRAGAGRTDRAPSEHRGGDGVEGEGAGAGAGRTARRQSSDPRRR